MHIIAPFQKGDGPAPLYEYRVNHHFSPGVNQKYRLLAAIIPCIIGIGAVYQAIATLRDLRVYPPPGRLVTIGDCQLHVQTAGRGSPSVILEAGLGGMSSGWGWIQPEIAKFSCVVSYDRAGLGWSGPDTAPKNAVLAARRLRTVLLHLHIPPPYILVGHSMGGFFIRVFADLYPDEVAGMVLLDAAHPDQHLRSTAISTHMRSGFRFVKTVPVLAQLGFVRLAGLFDAWTDGLPARQAQEAGAFLSTYRHLKTTREETLAWETICAEVRGTRGLGNTPLAVVTAARGVLPGHPELQRELTTLSADSFHYAVPGADHVTLVTQRENALTVVEVIRHVVERVLALRPGKKTSRKSA